MSKDKMYQTVIVILAIALIAGCYTATYNEWTG